MSSLSFTESDAEAWLLRAIQDQLRVDAECYGAQNMFRVQGFPTPWRRRRFPRDWPARLTSERIDWEASTINGPDPFRLINNDLFIEVSAAALLPDQEKACEAATPSGILTNRQAALKAQCIDWIRALPPTPPRAKPGVLKEAMESIPGLSERQAKAAWDDAAPAAWTKPGPK